MQRTETHIAPTQCRPPLDGLGCTWASLSKPQFTNFFPLQSRQKPKHRWVVKAAVLRLVIRLRPLPHIPSA